MINIEVSKGPNENSASLIRRFTKRVQGAGILPRVRSIRYRARKASEYAKKKRALRKLTRRATYEELYKLGKISEQPVRRGRRK
ncbi:hypothetical protein A3D62_03345 [Candidatus Kaiserbacteria bacterium RIFCSPHIGHO2_02_FULL_49_11]|uniref:30S ribosomal protein S21 n=1 Tax=Candidatus Kaiserbacteria bacterium RIFCSPHIGHO2_02_FULL_49_11 TaxID=1798489 RepID=A0A1F6CZS3_9BACT|nr:MAG: hypothetical protein A3D62_03345 [Candidatus Kaiserbacteria bacterium RIFCSPHIGHO2_02_FULL_49_11]